MTSYLIDGFLFLALLLTTWRVVLMYRQLRVMASHHEDYQRVFDQTSDAMDAISVTLQELRVRGEEISNTLSERIDTAKETTVDMNSVIHKAHEEMSHLQEYVDWLQAAADKVGVDLSHVDARVPDRPAGRGGRSAAPRSRMHAGQGRPMQGAAKPEASHKTQGAAAGRAAGSAAAGGKPEAGTAPAGKAGEGQSGEAVSAVNKQNLRVRKVSFGQAAPFRSVNVKD